MTEIFDDITWHEAGLDFCPHYNPKLGKMPGHDARIRLVGRARLIGSEVYVEALEVIPPPEDGSVYDQEPAADCPALVGALVGLDELDAPGGPRETTVIGGRHYVLCAVSVAR